MEGYLVLLAEATERRQLEDSDLEGVIYGGLNELRRANSKI